MAGSLSGAEALRAPARDPAAKLLGLLDFSAARGGQEALGDTLSVLLFSLMGEFAASGAAILLERGTDRLEVVAAKGRGSAALAGRHLDFSLAALGERPHIRLDDVPPELAGLAAQAGFELLVPVRHRGRCLGLLALGGRASRAPYAATDQELVRMVAGIAGTVIANHLLYGQLSEANRKLQRRLLDLHALFDVSAALVRACEPDAMLRLFAQTAMAHALVSQCVVLLARDGRLEVAFARGVNLGPDEADAIRAAGDDAEAGTLPRLADLLGRHGLRTLVTFRASSATRGLLALGPKKNGHAISGDELELLQTLANQAVTALDNLKFHRDRARREQLEHEIGLARSIQRGLFPRALPAPPGYRLAAHSEPCFEVGGDYYDALDLEAGGVLFTVADVSGKNLPAAILMSTLQATVRSVGRRPGETPGQILTCLNRNLHESVAAGRFATMFLARLDTRRHRLLYSNGGHWPPLLARRSGTVERLTTGGPLLGCFPDAVFPEAEIEVAPGDRLLVFTDGVSEAMNAAGEELGEARLEAVLCAGPAGAPQALVDRVLDEVRGHCAGHPQNDDVTLLVLERLAGGH